MRMKKETKEMRGVFLTEVTGGLLIVAAMTLLASLFTGCKTIEREDTVTKTDTVRIYTQRRDSVVYRDSVFVHQYTQGDTVYHVTERWNVRYNDRVLVDTVYKVREVQAQSKEVTEKKSVDDFFIKCGEMLMWLFALIMAICFAAIWWDERKRG